MSPLVLLSGVPDPVVTGLQVALDHAELSLRGGSPEEAKQQLDAIWSDVLACEGPDFERRVRLTRALTLEALGRLDDAIIELEDHLADGSQVGGDSIRAAVALSRCYRESGDLARAIEIGERHLDALRHLHLDGSDEAVQLVVTVAAAYFEQGDAPTPPGCAAGRSSRPRSSAVRWPRHWRTGTPAPWSPTAGPSTRRCHSRPRR